MHARTATLAADAPRSHAARTIFAMHYRRALLPLALVCYGIFLVIVATIFIAERASGKYAAGLAEVMNAIATALPLLVAAPAGSVTFSRPFKDQHIYFFHSLPISRSRQWLVMTAASLAALLTVSAGFLLLRPALVDAITTADAAAFLFALLAFFAAGACFSLAIRNSVAAILAGVVFLAVFVFLTAVMTVLPRAAFEQTWLKNIAVLDVVKSAPFLATTSTFVVLQLLLSFIFYRLGEMALLKTQVRNTAIVVAVAVATIVTVVPAARAVSAARAETNLRGVEASPDGRYLAALYSNRQYPWLRSLHITDIDRGTVIEKRIDGLAAWWWLNNNRLAVAVRDLPGWRRLGLLIPQSDEVQLLAPDGARLTRWHRRGAHIDDIDETRQLIATNQSGAASVGRLDADGSVHELFGGSAEQVIFRGDFVYFRNEQSKSRLVRTDTGAELPWIHTAQKQEFPTVFRGTVYSSGDAAAAAVEQRMPLPRRAGEQVWYATYTGWARDLRTLYGSVNHADGTAALYCLPDGETTWRLVADRVIVTGRWWSGRQTLSIRFRPPDRALYMTAAASGEDVWMHDPQSGKTTLVYHVPAAKSPASVSFRDALPFPTIDVSTGDRLIARFTADGVPVAFRLPDERILALRADGTVVRLSPDGRQARVYTPDGRLVKRIPL